MVVEVNPSGGARLREMHTSASKNDLPSSICRTYNTYLALQSLRSNIRFTDTTLYMSTPGMKHA